MLRRGMGRVGFWPQHPLRPGETPLRTKAAKARGGGLRTLAGPTGEETLRTAQKPPGPGRSEPAFTRPGFR